MSVILDEETLTGDLRDALLTHVRSMETPWSKLSEREQADNISAMTKAAETLVRGAVAIIAHRGFPHLVVSLGKWTVKDGIKLEVNASGSVDNINKLAEHGPSVAILVLSEANAFFGQKEEVKAEPDEPPLPFDGDEDEDPEDESKAA